MTVILIHTMNPWILLGCRGLRRTFFKVFTIRSFRFFLCLKVICRPWGLIPPTHPPPPKKTNWFHTAYLHLEAGMYDYSGEFAFNIGLPAKSAHSGAIIVVIPNEMGICTYSPLLDHYNNSTRGVRICKSISCLWSIFLFSNCLDF